MTVKGPRVRDFTGAERSLDVMLAYGEATETLLAMFVYGAGKADPLAYDCGEAWFGRVEVDVSPDARETVGLLGECGEVWLALLGEAIGLEAPRSLAGLVGRLREQDPVALRATLLRAVWESGKRPATPEQLAAAAAGDLIAFDDLAELTGRPASGMRALVEMTAERAASLVVSAVEAFGAVVESEVIAVLAQDARRVDGLAATMDPPALVERLTNGITFELQPDVTGVVLVPSVVVSPWVTLTEHGSYRVFSYGVTDDPGADPDAPPARLIEIYKALGDEKRLRILGELAGGPLGLAQVTERVELAKSTVHHHLRILRTAGLVRVTVFGDHDKAYSLRGDTVPEAARILEGYLGRRAADGHDEEGRS
ncbi:winged helix-turn-helix transcriptional regulator [bacterium]|nr:winged helix-turn-helix transcriptional regulator [bacterium]